MSMNPNCDACGEEDAEHVLCASCMQESAAIDQESGRKVGAARIAELETALRGLLAWSFGGACSDCDMFRRAPSCIDWQHAADCGHLESINAALVLLGREPETGHTFEDPAAEMQRLADERARAATQRRSEGGT